ncbi:MAG TPA: GNAT family protein [Candidatus Limiplasma sp.]|nr:GNAT family protein [Candidatus Limiplasma sp.]HPS81104.1 GNAT family protein [Candidatus Limiplasma sp.]
MKITHAVWEMRNLGVDAYETLLTEEDTLQAYAEAEREMLAKGAEYLVVKTPVNCPPFLFGLPSLGYANIETVFHVAIRRDEYHMPASVARFDRGLGVSELQSAEERERVYRLIRSGVFKSDRVSVDPSFSAAQAGNRYANWLAQMLERGGKLFEVQQGEKPIGFFVIMRVDEQTVDPVLMGMYDEAKDRGMGALLHKKTLDTCFEQPCARLTSTIVSNNAKVLRVYTNAGATIADTLYTYVKHAHPAEPDAGKPDREAR